MAGIASFAIIPYLFYPFLLTLFVGLSIARGE